MLNFAIENIEPHFKGKVYNLSVEDKTIKILITFHCLDRLEAWRIEIQNLFRTLLDPEEVLTGHKNRFIAHKRFNNHIIRAVYEYERELPVVITVYFPHAKRYYKGSKIYEDKIFS